MPTHLLLIPRLARATHPLVSWGCKYAATVVGELKSDEIVHVDGAELSEMTTGMNRKYNLDLAIEQINTTLGIIKL